MSNLILVRPREEYINEIRAYRDECRAYDTHSHGDNGLYKWDDISAWVNFNHMMRNKETLPKPEYVVADQFMLVRVGEPRILGMINFRHYLKEGYLAEHGGHIGYGVRPLERRKGYAKVMLALCLKEARAIGLEKVLLCCDLDNAGSRNTILACDGKFERLAITGSEVDERYWITIDENIGFHSQPQNETVQSPEHISAPASHPQNDAMQSPGAAPSFNHLGDYYANRNEDERLTSRHGLVEFLTTMRYIEEYLTPGANIIEIGAGTGRYSRTIADMGYKVEAVELISSNIDVFRENLKPTQDINITQANALDLSMFADNTYDITLLLGPLYHLYSDADKRQAIAEALRVTKPGGVVFAAYCLSDAAIISGFKSNKFDVKEYVKHGKINPLTFNTISQPEDIFELVRKEDIDRIMAPFAAERLHYVATDLFTLWISDAVDAMDDETFALYLRYHFAVCERADMVGASPHSLDIFRKNLR